MSRRVVPLDELKEGMCVVQRLAEESPTFSKFDAATKDRLRASTKPAFGKITKITYVDRRIENGVVVTGKKWAQYVYCNKFAADGYGVQQRKDIAANQVFYLNEYLEFVEADPADIEIYDKLWQVAMSEKLGALVGTGRNYACPVGSDPEVFVTDAEGEVIPAFSFLKAKPTSHMPGIPYWDGFQAEFNIDAQACHMNVCGGLRTGLRNLLDTARLTHPKAQLDFSCVKDIPQKLLDAASDQHVALGCAPSKNIYGDNNQMKIEGRDLPIRFAGFHIHYGVGKENAHAEQERIVKTIDRIYGIASVAFMQGLEDPRRRIFYGRAGEYRLPPHGIEYRVPSSAALIHPAVAHLTLDMARIAWATTKAGYEKEFNVPYGDEQVQAIINDLNVDEAIQIMQLNAHIYKSFLSTLYGSDLVETLWDAMLIGVNKHIDLNDPELAWAIGKHATANFTTTNYVRGYFVSGAKKTVKPVVLSVF